MVAEWLKAAVLKTVADASPPQVQILPIPRQALAQLVPIIEDRLRLTCRIFRHNNWRLENSDMFFSYYYSKEYFFEAC